MESLNVIPDLTRKGFRDGQYGVIEHDGDILVGGMPEATASGKPSVMIAIEDPSGSGNLVVCETTLSLFLSAADVLKARYGDPRE